MLVCRDDYATVRSDFVWDVPTYFNIGVDVCDKWADDPDRLALMYRRRDGSRRDYTFAQIKRLSNRFANVMRRHGIRRGDRVGILLPQTPETAISHVAAYKMGCIAVPRFTLFGVDAQYRSTENYGLAKPAEQLVLLNSPLTMLPTLSLRLSMKRKSTH